MTYICDEPGCEYRGAIVPNAHEHSPEPDLLYRELKLYQHALRDIVQLEDDGCHLVGCEMAKSTPWNPMRGEPCCDCAYRIARAALSDQRWEMDTE